MACFGCEQTAALTQHELDQVKQAAKLEGEKNKVDMVVYFTPEGWKFIRADQAIGLPVRELVLYARPTT